MNKCEACPELDTHYVSTDAMGYWHFFCDKHDPRPFFQEKRKLETKLQIAVEVLEEIANTDLHEVNEQNVVNCFYHAVSACQEALKRIKE